MTRKFVAFATLAFAITTFASPAAAQQVEVTSSAFANPLPGGAAVISNNNGDGTDRVCWGDGAQSGCPLNSTTSSIYTFNQVDGQFTPGFDTPFQLGTFVHYNNPIYEPFLTSVNLLLGYTIVGQSFSDTWTFTHLETTNSGQCQFQSTIPCADRVTFALTNGQPQSVFNVNGVNYTVNILGFGATANSITSSFITQEEQANQTILWAKISAADDPNEVVPEPATMTLLATGLAGMAAARRRRKGSA